MKCPHCNEEIREYLYDETPGAVFVAKDSDSTWSRAWPAVYGLKKYDGCVQFGLGLDDAPAECNGDDLFTSLNDGECDAVYADHPEQGEAWLVKPLKDGYEWERVDEDISFSPE